MSEHLSTSLETSFFSRNWDTLPFLRVVLPFEYLQVGAIYIVGATNVRCCKVLNKDVLCRMRKNSRGLRQ